MWWSTRLRPPVACPYTTLVPHPAPCMRCLTSQWEVSTSSPGTQGMRMATNAASPASVTSRFGLTCITASTDIVLKALTVPEGAVFQGWCVDGINSEGLSGVCAAAQACGIQPGTSRAVLLLA